MRLVRYAYKRSFYLLIWAAAFAPALAHADAPAEATAPPEPSPAPPSATRFDPPEFAKTLKGRHRLVMQWLERTPPGRMTFAPARTGRWRVEGSQRTRDGKGYVRISGEVVSATPSEIVLAATFETRVPFIARGRACARSDEQGGPIVTLTFSRYDGRKYFRLLEMDNPCERKVLDYVDLHL